MLVLNIDLQPMEGCSRPIVSPEDVLGHRIAAVEAELWCLDGDGVLS